MRKQSCFLGAVVFVAGVSLCVLLGCSRGNTDPRLYHVRGKVTYQGQPVPVGSVTFEPDPEQGGIGPQGFAEIVNGQFDTARSGRGTTGGGQIVVISGNDGQATEDNGAGSSLFSQWKTKVVVPLTKMNEFNFDVDAAVDARSGRK